jgi:hypothetical protein
VVAGCRVVRNDLERLLNYLKEAGWPGLRTLDEILALEEGFADGNCDRDAWEGIERCFVEVASMCRAGSAELAVFRSLLPKAELMAQVTRSVIVLPLHLVPNDIQCTMIREIFGNPFRPATLDPAWRTDTVVALARGIYDDRAFDRLPILADALQDAGCDNDDILNHCRDAGPHARGCWVVDLILGKS